jgi:short-subunit dehydrogenase
VFLRTSTRRLERTSLAMNKHTRRTAVIIGASSGIGEALARQLGREGWRLGLMARRLDRLETIARDLAAGTVVRGADVADPSAAAATLEQLIGELGGADLVIISAGTGHLNGALAWEPDRETVAVNVLGFTALAQVAMREFLKKGRGHLIGISSIAALHGSGEAAAYAASKAYQSTYLDGLREIARARGVPIAVTDVQPGFVETAMMKPGRPLPFIIRRFFVASAQTAARQILRAIRRRSKHVYITRRWAIIGFLLRRMPRPG